MSKLVKTLVLVFVFLSTTHSVHAHENHPKEEMLEGTVIEIVDENPNFQLLKIDVTKGFIKGETIDVENGNQYITSNQRYKMGDNLVISASEGPGGKDVYLIIDYVRYEQLLLLFIIFAILVVSVGQLWGALSLIGMGFSFLVIFGFILPLILKGWDAVLIAVVGSIFIIPVTFTFSHGLKRKTLIAGVSTIITLIITGVLSAIFVELTYLTGFASEEASFLRVQSNEVDLKGILLAGMIIATLGVLDDITISQSSIVEELKKANSKLKPQQVFTQAMNVGRDHIASLVNTLVLVYAGASLPLFLLFVNSARPFTEVINYEPVAEEIVRTLTGSIGLVLAVPITTFIASYYSVFWKRR